MKIHTKKASILGLILSGFASLALLLLLILKGLARAGIYQPKDPELLNQAGYISLGVFILGFAITTLINPDATRKFFSGRRIRHESNASIIFFAITGLLFSINLISYQNPKNWDVTESKKNSLAPETISILQNVPQIVYARAYFSNQITSTETHSLLENFKQNSNGKFEYEFIDPNSNPATAKNDGVSRDGTIILKMGELKEVPIFADEQEIASAILRLINPEKAHIYFLTGHGETDIEQTDDSSYSAIRTTLENKNYIVSTLNLKNNIVPADSKIIIITAPQTSLTTEEVNLLQNYLNHGGALIALLNPNYATKINSETDPLNTLLKSWGISPQNDIIYDPNSNPPLLIYANTLNYGNHPITNNLRGINSSVYTAQSLKLIDDNQSLTLSPLAQTYPEAWGENNYTSIETDNISYNAQEDNTGPLIIACVSENTTTNGKLIVFGDSDFATNALYKFGNGDILLKSIDWAAHKENLLNISTSKNTLRTFSPPGNTGLVGIIIFSLCGLPLLIMIGGITTSISRRKKG